MSTSYYPAADPGDHEHTMIKITSLPHDPYTDHLGYLEVGTPGTDKASGRYRPIMHITLPDEGKVEGDVTWAKIWLMARNIVGTPSDSTYSFRHVTQYDWYDYYTHGDACCDYTCYQHSAGAWTVAWGDTAAPTCSFSGPASPGWFSVDITDMVKHCITNHARDINMLIFHGEEASTSWNFNCKHNATPANRWYVEVEWAAAAAGKSQIIIF